MSRTTRRTSYTPLSEFLGLRPETGETPSGLAINEYLANIPYTPEQERQAEALRGMDARAEESYQRQRAQIAREEDAQQAGFRNATEASRYARRLQERELEVPLERERIQAETAATTQRGLFDRMLANQAATAERQARTQQQQAARAQQQQAATAGRQQARDAEIRARGIERDPEMAVPPAEGTWQTLQRFLGMGQFDPTTAARTAADRIRQEGQAALQGAGGAMDETPDAGMEQVARDILADYPGATPDQLAEIVQQEVTGGSPEELDALLDVLLSLQGGQ